MTTRWDTMLGCTIAACLLALTAAYLTGSAEVFVYVGVAAIALLLVVGLIWICAPEPLGEPGQPGDDLMAIADACAYVDRDRIDIALDPTIPPEIAFADDFEFLERAHNWSVKR